VAEATAALNIAEEDLRKTTFLAPQSGVVSQLNVEEGEHVVLGTMNVPGTVLLTVADLAHMQVECDVDETDVVRVANGQEAKVFVDAFPDTVFEATVVEVGSSGRSSSLTGESSATDFTVKLALAPGVENLKPGMTADAEIETATHAGVMTVPIQAVAVREKKVVDKWMSKREETETKSFGKGASAGERKKARSGDTLSVSKGAASTRAEGPDTSSMGKAKKEDEEVTGVFVVVNGKTKFVPVRTGIMSETEVEILSGLSDKDSVVTGPFKVLRDLKDDQPVKEEKKEKKKGERSEETGRGGGE
jgi:HlyD family secretion protein